MNYFREFLSLIVSVNPNANHVHFYIEAGKIETKPLLTANRRLYKGLKKKDTKPLMKSLKAVMIGFGGVKSYLVD